MSYQQIGPFALAALLTLGACNGPTQNGDSANDTSVATPTGPRDNEGSVVLVHYAEDALFNEGLQLVAVFADQLQGFQDAAFCATYTGQDDYSYCAKEQPSADDSFIEHPVSDVFSPTASDFSNQGEAITFGPLSAQLGILNGHPLYYVFGSEPFEPASDLGLTLSGDWGTYSGQSDLKGPSKITATSPAPTAELLLRTDEELLFEWETGEGLVSLDVHGVGFYRTYGLVDDGQFSLSLSDLPLSITSEALTFRLSRQTSSNANVNGNTVHLSARSEQWYYASLVNIIDRQPVSPVTQCAGDDSLPSGRYWGDVQGSGVYDGAQSDLASCDLQNTAGGEHVLPITLAPGEHISATLTGVKDAAAHAYFISDCADFQTCLGTGDYFGSLSQFNGTEANISVFLVIESPTGGLYHLDIQRDHYTHNAPANTCEEALLADPLPDGDYWADLIDYDDSLSYLPADSCTDFTTAGQDGFYPVTIAPFTRLTASLLHSDDGALYLTTDCADDTANTCLIGSDSSNLHSQAEIFHYLNSGDSPVNAFIAVDSYKTSTSAVIQLSLSTEAVDALPLADTCLEAERLSGVTPGHYFGNLSANADSLNPGTGGCTGYDASGPDGMVFVDLPPGQQITFTYSNVEDGSLYLVSDCLNADTCLLGDDRLNEPETLSLANTGTENLQYYLVLDGYDSSGAFELTVEQSAL